MNNSKHVFVAWQNTATREWIPVAKLTDRGVDHVEKRYLLQYTRGAERSWDAFKGLDVDLPSKGALKKQLHSSELFPFFSNRVLNRSRPEFKDYLRWLGFSSEPGSMTPLDFLALTGGLRSTDGFEIIPEAVQSENNQVLSFFTRGVRHLSNSSKERIKQLTPGTQLYLCCDRQNAHDSHAVLVRTADPKEIVGHVPQYFSRAISKYLTESSEPLGLTVQQVNADAHADFQLQCKLTFPLSFCLTCEHSDFYTIEPQGTL